MISENPASSAGNPGAKKLRVAVLFHRLGPYHHARLQAAARRMQVTAVEFSDVDRMYAWDPMDGAMGFERVKLFANEAVEKLSARRIRHRIHETLARIQPQAVAIPGWSDRCALAALDWCAKQKVPAVVMSESTAWDFNRQKIKEGIKGRLLKLFGSALVGGRAHAEYLKKLGFPSDRIFTGYDTVDNDYFQEQSGQFRSRAGELRRQHNLPERFFLASARFVPKKNLDGLVEAYARYRQLWLAQDGANGAKPWDLVIMGDGPLREALVGRIRALGLGENVLLRGFKQYQELPLFYALASAFIHPSITEQWGLVVNEAMACGLPVLVSCRCGCAGDLVEEGLNGFTFDPGDTLQMARLMLRCGQPDQDLAAMGRRSRFAISKWGTDHFAQGLEQAALAAISAPRDSFNLLDRLQIWLLMAHKGRSST